MGASTWSAAAGLAGVSLFALACLAFFVLLVGTLIYVLVVGNPETKRWKAFASTRGWDCDGPWRVSGGLPGAQWTLGADYDDDRGTGTITWSQSGVSPAAPRLLIVRRADYERNRDGPWLASGASRLGAVALDVATAAVALASNAGGGHFGSGVTIEGRRPVFDGLRDAGAGSPGFRRHWVVLAEGERTGRTFLDEPTDATWLMALDAMPSMFANHDVVFEVKAPHVRLRAEGARRRPPFEEVEAFVRLGLALAIRVDRP